MFVTITPFSNKHRNIASRVLVPNHLQLLFQSFGTSQRRQLEDCRVLEFFSYFLLSVKFKAKPIIKIVSYCLQYQVIK